MGVELPAVDVVWGMKGKPCRSGRQGAAQHSGGGQVGVGKGEASFA